jgi:hypothetical protein
MARTRDRKGKTGPRRPGKARLAKLVEDATVDCYDESEQVTGIYTMIGDNLTLPFETTVLGVRVTVERVQLTRRPVWRFCRFVPWAIFGVRGPPGRRPEARRCALAAVIVPGWSSESES